MEKERDIPFSLSQSLILKLRPNSVQTLKLGSADLKHSRFCYSIGYLSPNMFSETHFSALFGCNTKICGGREHHTISCFVKMEAK